MGPHDEKMTPDQMRDHYREILLMEYASGCLDQAESLLAETLVSLCKHARAQLNMCEEIGAAMLQSHCAPVKMSHHSLQSVLERLEDEFFEDMPCPRIMSDFFGDLPVPQPVQDYMVIHHHRPKWRKIAHGLLLCEIPTDSRSGHNAYLMRMMPGVPVTARVKRGSEYVLVLDGSIHDGRQDHVPGDLIVREEGVTHKFIAHPHDGCLTFIVSSSAPASMGLVSHIMGIFRR